MAQNHKDLVVWQKSMLLARQVHLLSQSIPKYEQFGLTAQLRRAAVSVPSNIAEGAARQSAREFLNYLHIARGSLAELETQLHLALDFGYIKSLDPVSDLMDHVARLINALIRALRDRRTRGTG